MGMWRDEYILLTAQVSTAWELPNEKANLDCGCSGFDCSICHAQWNACGQCPTATVSSWGFSYHRAPDVGVAALRQNERAAAGEQATHNGDAEASRVSRSRQYGILTKEATMIRNRLCLLSFLTLILLAPAAATAAANVGRNRIAVSL